MTANPKRHRSLVPRSLDKMEDRFILVSCLVIVGASVVGAIYDWPLTVQLPLIFLALYAILRNLLPLRGTYDVVRQIQSELAEVRAEMAGHQCMRFRHYNNNAEFYSALSEALLASAEYRLDVWYVRIAPPTTFAQKEAKRYFDSVLAWARANPSRTVRRLICVNSPAMSQWARNHHTQTKRVRNYEAHVVEWDIQADLLNMAIVDEKLVFLAFSGQTDQVIRGMSMDDAESAKYFSHFFDQHWATSKRLSEWATSRDPHKSK